MNSVSLQKQPGQLLPGVTAGTGEHALWRELETLQTEAIPEYELEKVKNKFEAETIFGELNVMNKAMNLGFYRMLGNMELLNGEVDIFRSVGAEELRETARRIFIPDNSSTLIYLPQHEK